MKTLLLMVLGLTLSPLLTAQAPAPKPAENQNSVTLSLQNPLQPQGAVKVKDEPHHVLVFQNDFVHVFNVTVPPMDATLLHQHDLPYLYLTLGQTDIVNAVLGKPDVRMTLEDGTTRYSPGGFAHIARADAGIPFHNITIELVKPQASPRNLGDKAADRPLGSCPPGATGPRDIQIPLEQIIPCFETDEVLLSLIRVEGGKDFQESTPKLSALLVAMSNADLDVSLAGQHFAFLHTGDVLWLPAGTARKVEDFLGTKSSFLLLSFKDSVSPAK